MKRCILLICAASCAMAYAAGPSFQGLGTGSRAYEVSGDGGTVVGITPAGEAGYWRAGEGWHGLGFEGFAYDANYDGTVIVGWTGESSSVISGNNAFRWSQEGGLEILPPPANQAYSVSADGWVTIGAHGVFVSDRMAFYHTPGDGTTDLSALLGLGASHARAVSGDGGVIGGSSAGPGFIWTVGEPSALSVSMAVCALSRDGAVAAGFRGTSNGSAVTRWTAESGVVELPQLSDDWTSNHNYGYDITRDGTTIVGYYDNSSGHGGLIWDKANGMRDLKDELETVYGLDLSGWELTNALVSHDGITFTGFGRNPSGQTEAWVAVIPEPATLPLLALGGLALIRGRRRRQIH